MIALLAAVLLPLYFTAPADSLGLDATGRVRLSTYPVHAYVFRQIDASGAMHTVPGYADSAGSTFLTPHAPGTRETAWLAADATGDPLTIVVLSRDENGNLSGPSNACVLPPRLLAASVAAARTTSTALKVPLVKQARQHCGQAALAMVLRYYGADPIALREVDGCYDPVLRGSLITDLAGAARRAGFEAAVTTLTPDSLISLLNAGVPPILLYQNGSGPLTVRHFGVVTGWDESRAAFTLNDGTSRPRVAVRSDLVKRWETAGSQALIVTLSVP
jgi:Peptidase C39 family